MDECYYDDFLEWADAQGYEFPCTAQEFYSRAARYAAGDNDLIDALCQQGVGPDWRDA